jgi:hypothetical protein
MAWEVVKHWPLKGMSLGEGTVEDTCTWCPTLLSRSTLDARLPGLPALGGGDTMLWYTLSPAQLTLGTQC